MRSLVPIGCSILTSGAVDRSVDSREQGCILHRLPETCYKVTFVETF